MAGYQLLRRLGQGAMAEVYLAEQISLRRQVAFKVLRANLATDATYVQRFHQEARAAAQLVHANIVQIYEVGCVDGVHFIAQEYVQGLNLAELLARRGRPTCAGRLDIMRQVAAALHKAAEHGIVHRDIKPENIMLAASGEVKVADFGLARLYSQDATPTNLTQVGVTMGTPLYMSPEQVEGRPLDPRSDIYSLGVTCYQMLTGEPPFRGETALSVAVQHLQAPAAAAGEHAARSAGVGLPHRAQDAGQGARRSATPRRGDLLRELRAISIELFHDDPGDELTRWDRRPGRHGRGPSRGDPAPGRGDANHGDARPAAAAYARHFAVLGRRLPGAGRGDRAGRCASARWSRWPTRKTSFRRARRRPRNISKPSMLNSEAAWKSVPQYFPDNQVFVHAGAAGSGHALSARAGF